MQGALDFVRRNAIAAQGLENVAAEDPFVEIAEDDRQRSQDPLKLGQRDREDEEEDHRNKGDQEDDNKE